MSPMYHYNREKPGNLWITSSRTRHLSGNTAQCSYTVLLLTSPIQKWLDLEFMFEVQVEPK